MPNSQPIPFPSSVPFVQSLGTEMHQYADGLCELRLTLIASHLNGWEVAHGGVVMTLLDVAMAFAARSMADEGMAVATIEMKTTFMRPAEGALRAVGKVLHRTRSVAFSEGALYDANGTLCATASGTFKYLRALGPRDTPPASTP